MSFIDASGIEYIIINPTECKIKSVNHGFSYTNIIIPNIAYNGFTPYNVTTIDGNLFDFLSPSIIVSVTIPTSVTSIAFFAFVNLINLENVYFNSPSNIQYINDSAFLNCINLKSIIIPASIKIIDNEAFSICESLTTVTFLDLTNVITSGGFAPNLFAGDPSLNTIYYNGTIQDYNFLKTYFSTYYSSLNVNLIALPTPQPIIPIECLCPKPPIPKQGISFGGNLNIPGHEEAQAFRISYQLINSLYVHGGRTEFSNAQQIRSRPPPPRNTFG
jgi:hypothetical protein